MLNLFKLLVILVLLGIPLLVITTLPRFFELAGSVPSIQGQQADATPGAGLHLTEATPTNVRARFGNLDDTPPPTLTRASQPASAVATPRPTAAGEHVSIGNTGGQGAILRAEPVSGRPVAALHEQQVLEVLERQTVPGGGVWVRVRTAEGVEGWVTGLVALPISATNR
ncbi:MAG: SH3 domain-containing protein [Chloroflexota bacterium]|nr:SH3 domain-containing protein [Chloroflexota bacterium]